VLRKRKKIPIAISINENHFILFLLVISSFRRGLRTEQTGFGKKRDIIRIKGEKDTVEIERWRCHKSPRRRDETATVTSE